MKTSKYLKFDFITEVAANNFAIFKQNEPNCSNVVVKGTTVYWVEKTTD